MGYAFLYIIKQNKKEGSIMNFKKLSLGTVFNATTASLMSVYDHTRDNTDTGICNVKEYRIKMTI